MSDVQNKGRGDSLVCELLRNMFLSTVAKKTQTWIWLQLYQRLESCYNMICNEKMEVSEWGEMSLKQQILNSFASCMMIITDMHM